MMLRFKAYIAMIVCHSLLGQVGSAHAEPKATAPSKPSAAKPAAANAAPASPAPPKTQPEPMKRPPGPLQQVAICVRAPGVHFDEYQWGYDDAGKLVTKDVEKAVKEAWSIYVFNYEPNAPRTVVDQLPAPYNSWRCPGDTRPPNPPPGAAAPATPTPTSIAPLLTPKASMSGELPDRVRRFCNDVLRLSSSGTDAENQALMFAASLRQAIKQNQAMPRVTINDLSPEAATILTNHLGETITAAMVYKQVIAPYNVQQKFRAAMGEPQWKIFPLVAKKWAAGQPDTVPAVLLANPVHADVTAVVDPQIGNATSPSNAKTAYQNAYDGLPEWLTAIQPYFP